jgi:hypothetical protein
MSKNPEQPLIVNIEGAVAKNVADAENSAVNVNVLQNGSGQNIDINQSATAIVNNMTAIIIGAPYPVNFAINNDDKNIKVEILENGEVKLNGEVMDIKALPNGMKVMFIHSDAKDKIINSKSEKNIDIENKASN